MLPERAEMMLAQYRRCVGRCAFLKKTIAEAEADIELWRRNLAEDLVLSGGANLDGMPHGTTVGNPTERMAIMLATGYEPEDLKDAEASLIPLRDELREKEMVLCFVEAWLEGLTAKERWLIEQLYFEGFTYNEAAHAYAEKYGIQISRDGIRRMKKATVQKVADMAK